MPCASAGNRQGPIPLTHTAPIGSSAFATSFSASTIEQTIGAAYDQIIGSANATAAGVDPAAGKAYFLGSLDFYKAVVTGRGGIAPSDPKFDLAVKAVVIGSILNEAVKAGLGAYADAYARMIAQLEAGVTTGLGGPLLTNYAEFNTTFTAAGVGFNTATATSSVEHTVTSDTTNDLINTTIGRLAGAVVNGKGAPGYDRLAITDVVNVAVTLGDGGAGGTMSGASFSVVVRKPVALKPGCLMLQACLGSSGLQWAAPRSGTQSSTGEHIVSHERKRHSR